MLQQREACKVLKKHFENKEVVGAEIGVCYGIHAESLLYNIPNLHLHLVDDFRELNSKFQIEPNKIQVSKTPTGLSLQVNVDNRMPVDLPQDRITWHKMLSVEAAKEIEDDSLDFAYIDADHGFKSVLEDLGAWYPKVKFGGVICGHDFGPEVKDAVDEFFVKLQKGVCIGQNTDDPLPTHNSLWDWWVFK